MQQIMFQNIGLDWCEVIKIIDCQYDLFTWIGRQPFIFFIQ